MFVKTFLAYQGQDWINEHWLAGNPLSYKEFAQMWQKEHERRKASKAMSKGEWAYITFTQSFFKTHPKASRNEITKAWAKERLKQVKIANKLLENISK